MAFGINTQARCLLICYDILRSNRGDERSGYNARRTGHFVVSATTTKKIRDMFKDTGGKPFPKYSALWTAQTLGAVLYRTAGGEK